MRPLSMLAVLALAAGTATFPVSSQAGASFEQDPPEELLFKAYRDVLDATTFSHVLMSAVQARLQLLKWGFGGWGLAKNKRAVQEEYDRLGARILEFRAAADALELGASDPLGPERSRLGQEARMRLAAGKIPDSVYEQVREILRIRDTEYDADVSRSSLIRAENALPRLGDRLGPMRLSPEQERALALAQGIHDELARFQSATLACLPDPRKRSSERDRKERENAVKHLGALETDATDLSTEISRMRILFMLNNILAGDRRPAQARTAAPAGKGETR